MGINDIICKIARVLAKILAIGLVTVLNRECNFSSRSNVSYIRERLPKEIVNIIKTKEAHTAIDTLSKNR